MIREKYNGETVANPLRELSIEKLHALIRAYMRLGLPRQFAIIAAKADLKMQRRHGQLRVLASAGRWN